MTTKINNVYINDTYTIAGIYERDGKIKDYIDKIYDKDLYYGMKTFESAETQMLSDSMNALINNHQDIEYIISGDLQNQISSSNYATIEKEIPYLGIFSACATFGEGLIIGANFIDGKKAHKIMISTSSHNMVAERQFRNPTEYGAPKKKTTTFTATGAASLIISNKPSKVKISYITPGITTDSGVKDVNHMGAVMAKAAGDTIYKHFKDLKITPNHYDLILTGDLGVYGKKILIEYLKELGLDISKNYEDTGLILYDINTQKVFAGASGPVCSALVLSSYIYKEMLNGKYKKVLFVPTGAIFSPTRVFQKETIPSIAHAISLEMVE